MKVCEKKYCEMDKGELLEIISDLTNHIEKLNEYIIDIRFIIADLKIWDEDIREKTNVKSSLLE